MAQLSVVAVDLTFILLVVLQTSLVEPVLVTHFLLIAKSTCCFTL